MHHPALVWYIAKLVNIRKEDSHMEDTMYLKSIWKYTCSVRNMVSPFTTCYLRSIVGSELRGRKQCTSVLSRIHSIRSWRPREVPIGLRYCKHTDHHYRLDNHFSSIDHHLLRISWRLSNAFLWWGSYICRTHFGSPLVTQLAAERHSLDCSDLALSYPILFRKHREKWI